MEPVRTEIKFNKTSCYFCSEWLENDCFKDHISSCSRVLEKCPNNCLAYVQRIKMKDHLTECPKVPARKTNGVVSNKIDDMENRFLLLEQDIGLLRSTLNEEIRQRLHLITDVGNLRKKNVIADEWTQKVSDVLNALKKCLNDETKSRYIDMQKARDDINKCISLLQNVEDWKMESFMRLDEIQSNLVNFDNMRGNIEDLLNDNGIHIAKINRLEHELQELRFEYSKTLNEDQSKFNRLDDRVKTLDSVLLGQNNSIQILNSETNKRIDQLTLEIENHSSKLADIVSKNSKSDYEIKSVKNIAHETEDKCDKLEKFVNEYKSKTAETQQNLTDLEVHLKYQNHLMGIHNTRGHLIWKIDKYSEKLKESKENDLTLRSPLFCNKQYGYTLRLDVNLNGIGHWKGRNLIASLTVVSGDYDSLLPWPCKLEADIILRDQPEDLADSKNLYKTIIVKRKNEKMDNNQYIFIPHKSISGCNFIKNDTIYLEVRVHQTR